MNMKLKSLLPMLDISGMILSLSGIILGVLLAVAEYHVELWPALSLILTAALIHFHMASGNRILLAASVAGAVLTAFLSFGTLFSLEPLLVLLFSYFIIRLVKGISDSGRLSEAFISCLVKGPIALFGAYFVCTHSFGFWLLLLPAFSIGLLCMTAEGLADGYNRHLIAFLTFLSIALMTAFSFMRILHPSHFLYVLAVPVFAIYIIRIYMKKEHTLDHYRSVFALCTFAFAVLTGLGFVGYLF